MLAIISTPYTPNLLAARVEQAVVSLLMFRLVLIFCILDAYIFLSQLIGTWATYKSCVRSDLILECAYAKSTSTLDLTWKGASGSE